MAIRQVKSKYATKDGRTWVVDITYRDYLGRPRRYHSKKFATRREAKDHEAEYKVNIKNMTEFTDLTFKQLIDEHYKYQQDKVKSTTLYNYRNMMPYLEPLFNIKVESFNIRHFELWRQSMNEKKISTRYKNGVYKYLKAVMNFGTKWYNLNFVKVYNKMTNFTNPNERKKEMSFYTPEEFQKFLSVEKDIKFRCAWQLLYYCGLRIGELKGITWKDIDFENKTVSINKQITQQSCRSRWSFSPPKTAKSNRVLPLTKVFLNDLKLLKESDSKILFGFNDTYFVIGDIVPQVSSTITARKNCNCEIAGVKQIRIHDFRHSCASLLIYKGANIITVSKFLGHTKIEETLNTYTHLYKNALTDITSLIDDMNEARINS